MATIPLPPLPASSVINVQMMATLNAQRVMTLYQYQITSAIDNTLQYTDYLNALYGQLTMAFSLFDLHLACCPDNYLLDFVRLQPVYPTRMRFLDRLRGDNGIIGQDASTSNIAASIERWSAAGKRHGIGRVAIPLADNLYADGLILNANLAPFAALANQMTQIVVSGPPAATFAPVIANTSLPNVVPRDIQGSEVHQEVRVMRRRTVGRGI